jgi:hypothetical protein
VVGHIRTLKPDIVVLAAYWDRLHKEGDDAAFPEKLLRTVEEVKAAGVQRIVLVGTGPFWTNSVPRLLVTELHRDPNSPIPHRMARSLLEAHDDTVLRETAEKAGINFESLFDVFCDQTSCLVTTGPGWEDLLMFDQGHLTRHGSVLAAQSLLPSILYSRNRP